MNSTDQPDSRLMFAASPAVEILMDHICYVLYCSHWETVEGLDCTHETRGCCQEPGSSCSQNIKVNVKKVFSFQKKLSFQYHLNRLWNIYGSVLYSGHISIWSLRLRSNVVCLLLLRCRVGKWHWIPRVAAAAAAAAAAVEISHFLEVCRLPKKTQRHSQIS